MSDTPRTDAACHDVYAQGVAHIPLVGFMEQLERELAAALKTLTDIRQLFVEDESFGSVVELLFAKPLEEAERELAEVTTQRDALKSAMAEIASGKYIWADIVDGIALRSLAALKGNS